MTLDELRAYIIAHFADNSTADIDALEMRTALLTLCERIEAEGSWQPILSLVNNGPYTVVKVSDWTGGQGVKPPTNVYMGAGSYVSDINLATNVRGSQGLQGLPGTGIVLTITQPGDGFANVRYYPILELPATSGGTYDFAEFEVTLKPWNVSTYPIARLRIFIANRGGFQYQWSAIGLIADNYNVVVYQLADGRSVAYIKLDNNVKVATARVIGNAQATVYASLIGQAAVTGTKVFDSSDMATYPPISHHDTTNQIAFPLNNSSIGNPALFSTTPGKATLSMGANMTGDLSDVGFLNQNYTGDSKGGFSWWQQLTSTTKRLLMYLRADGFLGIGTTAPVQKLHVEGSGYFNGSLGVGVTVPNEKLDVDGRVRTKGIVNNGAMPSIAKGAAVSSGTAALFANSTDMAGGIELKTAGSPTANAVLCSVTFTIPYGRNPRILISPCNAQSANATARVWATATSSGFTVNSGLTALDNSQTYEFSYIIIA